MHFKNSKIKFNTCIRIPMCLWKQKTPWPCCGHWYSMGQGHKVVNIDVLKSLPKEICIPNMNAVLCRDTKLQERLKLADRCTNRQTDGQTLKQYDPYYSIWGHNNNPELHKRKTRTKLQLIISYGHCILFFKNTIIYNYRYSHLQIFSEILDMWVLGFN